MVGAFSIGTSKRGADDPKAKQNESNPGVG